ncbi:MAG: T9SS type A sorting domain-containing protein [Cyclonatronaceae bacterium]
MMTTSSPNLFCWRKGLCAFITSLVAFFCFMHAAAIAQETVALNVSISPAAAQPGETVTLSISNENASAEALYFYGAEIAYDAARFSFEGITAGNLMGENALEIADELDENTLGASVVRTSGSGAGSGTLAVLEFTARPDAAEGDAAFSFSNNDVRDTDGQSITAGAPSPAEIVIAEGESFTVYYNNPNEWEEVFTYAFSSEGGEYVSFPGEAMTPPEGDSEWFSYEIPVNFNGAPMDRIIFSNGEGAQTENLQRNTDGWFDGSRWYDSEPDFDATRPVSFSVNMSAQIADERFNPETDLVYLRGINEGWDAEDAIVMEANAETPEIYETTVSVEGPETGIEEFKYYRAPADAFENGAFELIDEPDRTLTLGPAGTPQILETVFFNNEAPDPEPDARPVSFSVDMSVQITAGNFDPETDEATLSGGFNGWEENITLSPGENAIYETTLEIEGEEGSTQEYKFGINGTLEENGGEGENGNRILTLGPADTPQPLDTVFFNNDEGDDLPETVLVWPGDTNNNGVVNEEDVAPLGIYWNANGPAREDASTEWQGQEAAVWEPIPATYADTDGSGTVNQTDLLAVGLNFGETHGSETQNQTPPLAEVNLPPLSEGDKAIVRLQSTGSMMVLGASFGAQLLGIDEEAFAFARLESGQWADAWQEENALIAFERNEDLQLSAAAVHKGLTAATVASELFSFEIQALGNWSSGGTLLLERAGYVNEDGSQLSFEEIEVDIEVVTGTSTGNGELPATTALHQNYPNPFNPSTSISFDLQQQGEVSLEVLNVLGQRVATLINRQEMSAGSYTQRFDASRLPSGMYLMRLSAGEQQFTRKMMLVK